MSTTVICSAVIVCDECCRKYQTVHLVKCDRCGNMVCEGCFDHSKQECKWCKKERERLKIDR